MCKDFHPLCEISPNCDVNTCVCEIAPLKRDLLEQKSREKVKDVSHLCMGKTLDNVKARC